MAFQSGDRIQFTGDPNRTVFIVRSVAADGTAVSVDDISLDPLKFRGWTSVDNIQKAVGESRKRQREGGKTRRKYRKRRKTRRRY